MSRLVGYERDYETELRVEITKWSTRLAGALKSASPHPDEQAEGERFLVNIRAYQQDAEHFLSESDLVRSFECVVWAWSWLEIGEDVGVLRVPALRQD